MNIQLHFAHVALDSEEEDIPTFDFKSPEELYEFLLDETDAHSVFLLVIGEGEAIVSYQVFTLIHVLQGHFAEHKEDTKVFFQEYNCHENAYEVATMINEELHQW